MKYTLPLLIVAAAPAQAHHEAAVATMGPTVAVWALTAGVVGLSVWRRWTRKDDSDED